MTKEIDKDKLINELKVERQAMIETKDALIENINNHPFIKLKEYIEQLSQTRDRAYRIFYNGLKDYTFVGLGEIKNNIRDYTFVNLGELKNNLRESTESVKCALLKKFTQEEADAILFEYQERNDRMVRELNTAKRWTNSRNNKIELEKLN